MLNKVSNILNLSSGKDSTAMLLLAIRQCTSISEIVFADTGNEHQHVYDYLDYLSGKIGVAIKTVKADFTDRIAQKRNFVKSTWTAQGVAQSIIDDALSVLQPTGVPFLDLCLWKSRFPSRKAQFCTQELKVAPVLDVLLSHARKSDRVLNWQGIRRDESPNRKDAAMMEVEHAEEHGVGLFNYRPIIHWSAADVFDIHRAMGVKPNPLYSEGMGRVGCMPCINCSKDELNQIANRYPQHIDKIKRWEELVSKASKIASANFFHSKKTPFINKDDPQQIADYSIDDVVYWAGTGRGGRTYDLFDPRTETLTGCHSVYGLCDSPIQDNGQHIPVKVV